MPISAAALPFREHAVRSADGVRLAVQEWGNPAGRPILFVHGYCQSHRSWDRQLRSELARAFRLISFDLRGHGASEQPEHAEAYREGRRWAGDVHAILEQLELHRPVLVGWSYGGRVLNDYLEQRGDTALAGLCYVAATSSGRPGVLPATSPGFPEMLSEDLAERTAGTRRFLEACTAKPSPAEELAAALEFNMKVPARIRALLRGRPAEYDDVLRAIRVPVLVVQGLLDRLVLPAMSEHTLALVKHARPSLYPDCGHAPFQESPARFNAELQVFVGSRPPVTRDP